MKIEGRINKSSYPIIQIYFENFSESIPVIVDTGFNGELMLPETIIRKLDLEWIFTDTYRTASGDIVETNVYKAYLLWFDKPRITGVMATN